MYYNCTGTPSYVCPTKKNPPILLLIDASPLLKENRETLIPDKSNPACFYRPDLRVGFASGNEPINALAVKVGQQANEQLQGEELDEGTRLTLSINTVNAPFIFHGNAHPDISIQ